MARTKKNKMKWVNQMRGGFLGNVILVVISIVLLATIFGLFFGFNLLDIIMSYISMGVASAFNFLAGIINPV